jgi:hypothetical protein
LHAVDALEAILAQERRAAKRDDTTVKAWKKSGGAPIISMRRSRAQRLERSMKKMFAAAAAALAATAALAPAVAAPERKTEIVDQGKAVDSLLLRYVFEGTWVLDKQSILMRDSYRDHYLVTLEKPCGWIELSHPFSFFPSLSDRVLAGRVYEVRDNVHEICTISKIEKISREAAQGLRAKLAAED